MCQRLLSVCWVQSSFGAAAAGRVAGVQSLLECVQTSSAVPCGRFWARLGRLALLASGRNTLASEAIPGASDIRTHLLARRVNAGKNIELWFVFYGGTRGARGDYG